jgi:transposase InsO family protein
MKHVDKLSRWLPDEKEKKPITVHNREFALNHPPVAVHYLSPGWQKDDSYVPILELERWKYALGKDGPPVPYPQSSQYEIITEDQLVYRQTKNKPETRQLWVPPSLRSYVLHVFHDPPSVGHIGMKRMLATMLQQVWWPGMSTAVAEYCKSCTKCQQFKPHTARVPMASKPIPAKCLDDISMDLVGPVPSAWSGSRYVLCVQDRLSRFVVFAPMQNATATVVAKTFLSYWVCQFGAPKRIVTDRGSNFMSEIFSQLCSFLGTRHAPTTAYRPQGNAQNERAHKELHQYIAMYLHEAKRANWDLLLNQAAWVHNSSYHTALGRSPFEVLTGMKPRNAAGFLPDKSENKQLELTLQEYYNLRGQELETILQEARCAIAKAQATSQELANRHARVQNYRVNDEVWVRTHALSYVGRKWSEKYTGPFRVKEVISPQVLRVVLKSDPTYEDVVHTSYIKPRTKRVEFNEEGEEDQVDEVTRNFEDWELIGEEDEEFPALEDSTPDPLINLPQGDPQPSAPPKVTQVRGGKRNVISRNPQEPLRRSERLKNLRSFIQDRRAVLGQIVPNLVPRLRQFPAPAPVPDTANVPPPVPTSPKTTRFNRFMRRLRSGTPRSARTEDFRTPISDQSDTVSPSDSFQSADSHISEPNTPVNPSRSDLVRRLSYSPFSVRSDSSSARSSRDSDDHDTTQSYPTMNYSYVFQAQPAL